MLFLKEDIDLGVTVRESETLDFRDIRRHLDHWDSVFITSDPRTSAELAPTGGRSQKLAPGAVQQVTTLPAEKTDSDPKLYYVSDD